jgi:hypothetical protein
MPRRLSDDVEEDLPEAAILEPFVSTLKMGPHEVVVPIGPEFLVKIWVDGEPWDAAEMD